MIQIRTVDLSSLHKEQYQKLYLLASPDRQRRADRYLRYEDSCRCIVSDALLRYALRQVLGTDQVTISQTPEGKPFLRDHDAFRFNLSHSGHWVVIAWADRPVGIDVEMRNMSESKEQLAKRFFHGDEQDYLFSGRGQERADRFFEIWTKKESYLKFQGTGINRPLNSFSVLDSAEAAFHTHRLTDAVMTLCAEDPQCRILPLTVEMLLPD